MTKLIIRSANTKDYSAIASIYNEAITRGGITMDGHFYAEEHWQTIAQKMGDREILLVAEIASKVIGWGIIKQYSDRLGYRFCCETSIYLTCSETGNGYGTTLQKSLMEKVAEYGYQYIVAKILAANQDSIRFHQKFGFEIVGTQKRIGFINEVWHDVVIMQYLFPLNTTRNN